VAVPRETQWPIEEHTKAKHAILRSYLNAWFPILGSAYPTVVFVDGFCGPGRYSGGEPGSPLIAIQAALEQTRPLPGRIVFLFSDEREDRVTHLTRELSLLETPSNFAIHVRHSRFDEAFSPLLDELASSGQNLAPTFAFLDPFGFSGLPFSLVERILRNPSCEVFITFMVNAVQRFVDHPRDQVRAEIKALFGTDEAVEVIRGGADRVERLRALYQTRLRTAARFVRSFEIGDMPGRVLYYLYFASNNRLGHEKMKEAMWGVDREGRFRFIDNTDPTQLVLLSEDPAARLGQQITSQFAGRLVLAQEVLSWVMDETVFLDKHTRAALKRLEGEGNLDVPSAKASGKQRRRGTFPPDAVLRFK
jgi:three-Cys-motif partner protein